MMDIDTFLNNCPYRLILPVIQRYVREHQIDLKTLMSLNSFLSEASHHRKKRVNWIGISVFALYVAFQITDYEEIKALVYISRSTVKRYVQKLYESFGIPREDFHRRAERRKKLRTKAMELGFTKRTFLGSLDTF